jgi:hypothetical protein
MEERLRIVVERKVLEDQISNFEDLRLNITKKCSKFSQNLAYENLHQTYLVLQINRI